MVQRVIVWLLAFSAAGAVLLRAQSAPPGVTDPWIGDLRFVVQTLRDRHPNLYYRVGRDDFERVVADAERRIRESQTDEARLAAIGRVVASIRDGHTALSVNDLAGYGHVFPVRLYEFTDGIFITGIARELSRHVGARVVRIGRLPAAEAFQKAGELASADNEFSRQDQTPLIAITGRWAYGLGIIDSADSMPLVVETPGGTREEIRLSPITSPQASHMLRGIDIGPAGSDLAAAFTGTTRQPPLYLRHLNGRRNYWFEHDQARKIVYVQLNAVINEAGESFAAFHRRLFDYIDQQGNGVETLVLDLRFNHGGNGMMLLPFLNEIIRRDRLNRPGHLYTLIGRRTYSAAVLLLAEMMLHTHTLLVGEPAGAAQNMFSDMKDRGTLPHSGAVLQVSSETFNVAWPAGRNEIIPPHYPAPLSSADFFSGGDPALEAIQEGRVRAVATVLREEGPIRALEYFTRLNRDWGVHRNEPGVMPFTCPISITFNNGGADAENAGYSLMGQGKMDEARAAFELNVRIFPRAARAWESYARFAMASGDRPAALKYYRQVLALEPDNRNAARAIERLEKAGRGSKPIPAATAATTAATRTRRSIAMPATQGIP